MAGKYFGIPFALSGDRTAIPDAAQPDGSVSFTQGFTLDYELENTDPNYKPVPREESNALYYAITEAIGIVQKQGFADWTIAAAPYPINTFVRHNDIVWRNTVAGNSAEPGTDATWLNTATPTSILPTGYFSGFSLANDGAAPNTTISVSAGSARSSDNNVDINLANSLRGILQSSGSWAAGDNQNKLLVGARTPNTWYHVFSIRKTSDGTADIALHPSINPAADMPVGYAGFVWIESIRTDGSGNIRAFIESDTDIRFITPVIDQYVASTGTAKTNYTISVPPGRRVNALIDINVVGNDTYAYVASPEFADVVPLIIGASYGGGIVMATSTAPDYFAVGYEVVTDASSQMSVRCGSASSLTIVTKGWRKRVR